MSRYKYKFRHLRPSYPGPRQDTSASVRRTPPRGLRPFTPRRYNPGYTGSPNGRAKPSTGPNYGARLSRVNSRPATFTTLYSPAALLGQPQETAPNNRLRPGHEHCHKRKARRQILFSMNIAGKNKTLSPGKGGTYHRTEESRLPC